MKFQSNNYLYPQNDWTVMAKIHQATLKHSYCGKLELDLMHVYNRFVEKRMINKKELHKMLRHSPNCPHKDHLEGQST